MEEIDYEKNTILHFLYMYGLIIFFYLSLNFQVNNGSIHVQYYCI